jgi:hypothetical protein
MLLQFLDRRTEVDSELGAFRTLIFTLQLIKFS